MKSNSFNNRELQKGKLYLIPTLLGETAADKVLPNHVISLINTIDEYIVENSKSARAFLKAVGITIPQSDLVLHELDKHNANDLKSFLKSCDAGKNIGLISEAGAPGVADPGADVVFMAHQIKIQVVPLVGPSSILLALMASGLNGQQFCFHGYLPVDKSLRDQKIKQLERESQQKKQTQIFIETPYRNNAMMESIIKNCSPQTLLCVASEITTPQEFIMTKEISEWKKSTIDLHKKPTVFLMLGLNYKVQ